MLVRRLLVAKALQITYRSGFLSSRCRRLLSTAMMTGYVDPYVVTPVNVHSPTIRDTTYRGVFSIPHASSSKLTNRVEFKNAFDGVPVLRQMDYNGTILNGVTLPFTPDQAVDLFKDMIRVAVYDQVLYDVQRQGRISFYLTNSGEEASQVGSGFAFEPEDVIFAQYRELGTLLQRGFTVDMILSQCLGNADDHGKGRQMPVHYGSRVLNIPTISSTVGTQITHAVGAGYALKIKGKAAVAVGFFGDGGSSEGDFAVGLNMAATLGSQVMFMCRNNGYAISTPVTEQYKGDGVAARGVAYGVHSIRVDGNDIVAVINATKKAREICLTGEPVLIELMTYRGGNHSTSDDSSRYRCQHMSAAIAGDGSNPITRFFRHLRNQQTREDVLDKLK